MDLPKSIVKEFAKQAVEKKPTVDKPTQLVGTVQVEDGQTFVYLDGSNGSKTPVSETVAYQSGDRVLVSIQNRKATIIGNYTGPSINQALDNVIVEYALSSNSVSFIAWPGEKGEWNTIAPEKEDGSYMWQRTTKISTNTLVNPEISLTCIQGSDGENGYTPYIGSNGNWWINGVDTGYSAEGDDGHSPYVNTTTNTWWEWDADIGGYHDTGIVPQGPGVFKSIVFKRFSSQPSTPTGGSYLSPVPSGWSDGIPSGTEQIWISTRVFTSDGESPQTSEWTTPQMTSDTPDIDFEYSWIITNPGNPTDNPDNWSNAATENSIWMAVRKKSIGTWSSWEINKIKGEMSAEQLAQLNQASSDASQAKSDASTAKTDASAAKESADTLSDKARSGYIETLSGTGFVQSNKTEDGGISEVVVYGKSEQLVTEQSANLCPKYDKWTLSGGAYVDGDYIVFPSSGAKAQVSVHWKKVYNYLWFNISGKSDSDKAVNLYIGCSNGNGWARQLTTDETVLSGTFGGDGDDYGNKLLNSDYLTFTLSHYGTETGSMRIRNFMVSNPTNSTYGTYVPFVPDSPSPEYPSEIQNVVNPKVTVTAKNLLGGEALANVIVEKGGTKNLSNKTVQWQCSAVSNKSITESIKFKENTQYSLILYGKCLNDSASYINFNIIYTDGSEQTREVFETAGEFSYAIVKSKSGKTIKNICFWWGSNGTILEYEKCGLFEGIVNTEQFEPYKGNTATLSGIVLRSLSDGTRDRLFKDSDGLWKIERNCGEVTYNGTESGWGYESAKNNCYIKGDTNKRPAVSFCSHFRYGTGNAPRFTIGSYFNFYRAETTTLAEWKTWLASNPITVVYALATPTYETLPDSIQEELNALTTYNPITNVFVSAGVTPYIDVSFWTRDYYAKNAADNAAKTATNYIHSDSTNGLVINNNQTIGVGYDVQLKADGSNTGMNIRQDGNILASFLQNHVSLGKNSINSKVGMCGDKGGVSASFGYYVDSVTSNNAEMGSTLSFDFNETTFKNKVGQTTGFYEFTYTSAGGWKLFDPVNDTSYAVTLSQYGITMKTPTSSIKDHAGITINYVLDGSVKFYNADISNPVRKLELEMAENPSSSESDYANITIERQSGTYASGDGKEHSIITMMTLHEFANVATLQLFDDEISLNATHLYLTSSYGDGAIQLDGDTHVNGNLFVQGDNLVSKIQAMFCAAYTETLTVKNGTFTNDGSNASLVGNNLYLHIIAKANAAITAGNITNQTMLTINFTDNRISTLYSVSGSGGSSGPNSQMLFTGASSGGQHTITVTLAAIAQNIAKGGVINAKVSIPCVLNWDAY